MDAAQAILFSFRHHDWLTLIFTFLTELANERFLVLFALVGYWFWHKEMFGRALLLSLWTVVLNAVLKEIFQCPRPPQEWRLEVFVDWSFPSGHTQQAIVLWGWLAYELKRKWAYGVAALLVSGIALSRIYLGAHYLNDILGGLGFGFLTLLVGGYLFRKPLSFWHKGRLDQKVAFLLLLHLILLGVYQWAAGASGSLYFYKTLGATMGFWIGLLFDHHLYLPQQIHIKDKWPKLLLIGVPVYLLLQFGVMPTLRAFHIKSTMGAEYLRYFLSFYWLAWGGAYLCHTPRQAAVASSSSS